MKLRTLYLGPNQVFYNLKIKNKVSKSDPVPTTFPEKNTVHSLRIQSLMSTLAVFAAVARQTGYASIQRENLSMITRTSRYPLHGGNVI